MNEPPPRLRILVVEDEALIAEDLRLTLEDLGYEVPATCYTFAEAQAALAGPTALPADLVLLDLNLGGADPAADGGLALARLLGEQAGGPPFIFLTAYADLATIRQATQLRPSGYLIKPVNAPTLFAAIQSALAVAATSATELPAPPPGPLPFFFVKLGEHTYKVQWAEVQRLEVTKNYVLVYPSGRAVGYPLRGSLAYVLDQLLPAGLRGQFLRVSRRLCLNAAYITGYDSAYIYCGPDRYENDYSAQRQLAALRLP